MTLDKHIFHQNEEDDLYGSIDDLVRSYKSGAEQERFTENRRNALAYISRYSGGFGGAPQAPQPLPPLEDELPSSEGDPWE